MGIIDPVASVDHQTRTPETHVITLWKTHCDLKNMNSYETDVFCLLTLGINLEISIFLPLPLVRSADGIKTETERKKLNLQFRRFFSFA